LKHVQKRTRELEDAGEAPQQSQRILAAELDVARRLQHVATHLITADGIEALYEQILDTAMAILQSDFASIQMFHPERGTNGELRLLGHRGFNAQAAKRWEWVDSSSRTTCGEALRIGRRVAVADVRRCDFMAESDDLEGYLAGGILAVQTTPLVSRSGALVGMVSTHWREPHELSASELRALDILAQQAADLIERSRAEQKLRRSEELLRSAQRLAHVGSWEWDFKTNQVSWSDEEFEVFGQPRDYKPSYEGFLQAVIPQERERVARDVRDALAEKRGFSSQVHIIRPDGELRTISFIAEVRFDNEGSPVGMFGATQDITDVKKNEAKLLQSQKDLRALTARLVDLQESGMKELARELHDTLSQSLAALGMEISTLLRPSAKRSRSFSERVRALQLRIKQMSVDLHSISMRLHPAILDELGLKAALEEECRRFSAQTGIPIRFESEGESTLPAADVSLCFYRVAQESLHNIAKHAGATKVRLTLYTSRGTCTLRIEDNGQGFDPSGAKGKNALGLISMKERARLVNGNFTIRSEPGKGTTLEVSAGSQRKLERRRH
jgi:PAS domain S-box-containing protein